MAVTEDRAPAVPSDARAAGLTVRILDRLLPPPRSFAVRLWNGTMLAAAGPPAFTLVLLHPGALRRMLVPPTDLAIGEAYVRGDFDVDGDLEGAVATIVDAASRRSASDWLFAVRWALALPATPSPGVVLPRARPRGRKHSLHRDRIAVRHHYDAGNEFYALWLDRRMVYSCAYFPTGTEDLDRAQDAKLEHICRKLRLQPGERFLDIGCGWGGLVLYAAERYGVQAVGVTLSEPQAALAQERITAANLTDRAEVRTTDYREIRDGPFDKLVSVGMFEHVGRSRLPEYFAHAWSLLRPGGLFLNHGIASGRPLSWRRLWGGPTFMQAHIFPDGELEPISETMLAAERCGFEVRDVENLREHYTRTLRLWLANLDAHRDEAVARVGLPRFRTWRIFLAASAQGFASGRTSIFQAVLARPDASGTVALPWSRADLYRP